MIPWWSVLPALLLGAAGWYVGAAAWARWQWRRWLRAQQQAGRTATPFEIEIAGDLVCWTEGQPAPTPDPHTNAPPE